jgi:hypothetical protein
VIVIFPLVMAMVNSSWVLVGTPLKYTEVLTQWLGPPSSKNIANGTKGLGSTTKFAMEARWEGS